MFSVFWVPIPEAFAFFTLDCVLKVPYEEGNERSQEFTHDELNFWDWSGDFNPNLPIHT